MNKGVDYSEYILTPKDRLTYGLAGVAGAAVVARIFYKSLMVFIILAPVFAVILPRLMRKSLKEKRLGRLSSEFKEAMSIVNGYLSAGYSVENAFSAAISPIKNQFGRDSVILPEFVLIVKGLKINKPIEEMLGDFARRSGSTDIKSFAEVFQAARHYGGNMAKIIEKTTGVIREKMTIMEEIKTITAAKKYEQKIMTVMPLCIVLYLDIATPGFLDVMYESLPGRVVMTLCLAASVGAYMLSMKLLDIKL
ncbi:MAG: type II secretion system protein F [Eubacteriales bacterium]|nr:type II secretion system protein F [Eubacteriales bacterium]